MNERVSEWGSEWPPWFLDMEDSSMYCFIVAWYLEREFNLKSPLHSPLQKDASTATAHSDITETKALEKLVVSKPPCGPAVVPSTHAHTHSRSGKSSKPKNSSLKSAQHHLHTPDEVHYCAALTDIHNSWVTLLTLFLACEATVVCSSRWHCTTRCHKHLHGHCPRWRSCHWSPSQGPIIPLHRLQQWSLLWRTTSLRCYYIHARDSTVDALDFHLHRSLATWLRTHCHRCSTASFPHTCAQSALCVPVREVCEAHVT
jgi:hypothetical protein